MVGNRLDMLGEVAGESSNTIDKVIDNNSSSSKHTIKKKNGNK